MHNNPDTLYRLRTFSYSLFNFTILIVLLVLFNAGRSVAQNFRLSPNDTLNSLTILPNNIVEFRVYAPSAKDVKLGGSDIPDSLRNVPMKKQENGVWVSVVGPLEPGCYRYEFIIDNIHVIDPRNPVTSQSNMNSWSLLYVPGADFMDTKDVPHGAISEVIYFSRTLSEFRRIHVYTPPGYESGNQKFPVLYLLHGAFDCDDSWHTVGRSGFILDNLIAQNKIVPMVVIMPAGHTGPFSFLQLMDRSKLGNDVFIKDFTDDIKPYIENNFRVLSDRQHRAICGLSMGGAHTLNIAIPHLKDFAYLGVFSSGIFGIAGSPNSDSLKQSWEKQNIKMLTDNEVKKDLKVVWFATGKDDFLLETSRATVALLQKHGFNVTFKETTGGHTWKNWREYLYEYVQLLFR